LKDCTYFLTATPRPAYVTVNKGRALMDGEGRGRFCPLSIA
jgi:hypothetical protein